MSSIQFETLLTTEDISDILNVPKRTIEDWRYRGEGPEFIQLTEKTIRYKPKDLREFIESRRYQSTDEFPTSNETANEQQSKAKEDDENQSYETNKGETVDDGGSENQPFLEDTTTDKENEREPDKTNDEQPTSTDQVGTSDSYEDLTEQQWI